MCVSVCVCIGVWMCACVCACVFVFICFEFYCCILHFLILPSHRTYSWPAGVTGRMKGPSSPPCWTAWQGFLRSGSTAPLPILSTSHVLQRASCRHQISSREDMMQLWSNLESKSPCAAIFRLLFFIDVFLIFLVILLCSNEF